MAKKESAPPPKQTAHKDLPSGFTEISATAESWDFDKNPILQGVIRRMDQAKVKAIDGGALEMRNVMHVEDDDGVRHAVWESAGNRALFECKIGDRVYIEFTGLGEQKDKKKNPPRLYRIGVQNAPPM